MILKGKPKYMQKILSHATLFATDNIRTVLGSNPCLGLLFI